MSFLASLFRALFLKKQQPDQPAAVSPAKSAAVAGSIITAIMAFVQPWEGTRYTAYQDVVGVWTICTGRTKDVKPGDTATQAQCDAWLAEEIAEFNAGVNKCVTRPMKREQEIAFTSLAYNIGINGFCGSTAVRKFNAGDNTGACEAIELWNKAGGKVVKGLVNRRQAESDLCASG